jgi:lipopolysaccharide biosynthesis regulator YciM
MKSILIGTLAAILAAGAESNEAERQLRAAMNAELVNGDLKVAIRQYGEIAAKYKNNRAVAAMALVRLAECYEKMGDARTRKVYEQVVRVYGDQKDAVALARTRLAGGASKLTGSVMTARQVWAGPKVDDTGKISSDARYLSFTDGVRGL